MGGGARETARKDGVAGGGEGAGVLMLELNGKYLGRCVSCFASYGVSGSRVWGVTV